MIRRDLYAVKADERDADGECYVLITKFPSKAFRRCNAIKNDHSLGLNRLAKVVHPSQRVVDVWSVYNKVA